MTRPHFVLLGCLLILAIAVGLIWYNKAPSQHGPSHAAGPTPPPAPAVVIPRTPLSVTSGPIVKPPIHKFKFHYPPDPDQAAMLQWLAAMNARDPAFEWKIAINFDGLVVDENNTPLPDADVKWISTNVNGNGRGTTVSGGDGRFSINTTGKTLEVLVTKEGYRTVERNAGFEFAAFYADNYYDHDRSNPVIFHLRKVPKPEPIYIIFGGSRKNLIGDKISINTRSSGVVPGEQPEGMWIQFVPGPQNSQGNEQYDIVLGTAPGGGVTLITEDADELAPQSGYQSPLDTQQMAAYNGSRFTNMKAFFKDGNGNYGSVALDIELGGHNLTLSYLLKYNPNGGRSLTATRGSAFQINK